MEEFSKSPVKHHLLCKQQLECFLQLSESIAKSSSSESLLSIYDIWKNEKLTIFNNEMTIEQLMRLSSKETNYLMKSKSPDYIACF